MKLIVWGTGKNAENLLGYLDMEQTGIEAFVESAPKNKEYREIKCISPQEIENYAYEFIVIASSFEAEIKDILIKMNVPEEKVLWWNRSHVKEQTLQKLSLNERGKKIVAYKMTKSLMPYQVCEADNTSYMYSTRDSYISTYMIEEGKTFSKDQMDALFEIAPLDGEGYFFDIGANIGTTSIYVKRNISKALKVVAFEPIDENYKLFSINKLLNDCEDIVLEKLGISNENKNAIMQIDVVNPGGCAIVSKRKDNCENVKCVTLDHYIGDKGIEEEKIKYFWLDVEGHESYVIEGAMNTLLQSNGVLCMEFNSSHYMQQNSFQSTISNLKKIYRRFVCLDDYVESKKDTISIDNLEEFIIEKEYKPIDIIFLK